MVSCMSAMNIALPDSLKAFVDVVKDNLRKT